MIKHSVIARLSLCLLSAIVVFGCRQYGELDKFVPSSEKVMKIEGTTLLKDGSNPQGTIALVEGRPNYAQADEDGFFTIENIPEGNYTLRGVRAGYKVARRSFKAADKNVILELEKESGPEMMSVPKLTINQSDNMIFGHMIVNKDDIINERKQGWTTKRQSEESAEVKFESRVDEEDREMTVKYEINGKEIQYRHDASTHAALSLRAVYKETGKTAELTEKDRRAFRILADSFQYYIANKPPNSIGDTVGLALAGAAGAARILSEFSAGQKLDLNAENPGAAPERDPRVFSSHICAHIGKWKRAYFNTDHSVELLVGGDKKRKGGVESTADTDYCLGRCGSECAGEGIAEKITGGYYTQACLNHDACMEYGRTDGDPILKGACHDEFFRAMGDWILAIIFECRDKGVYVRGWPLRTCAVKSALSRQPENPAPRDHKNWLAIYYKTRYHLSRLENGRKIVDGYHRHFSENGTIIAANAELRKKAKALLEEAAPDIQLFLAGKIDAININQERIDRAISFLDDFRLKGSSKLKASLAPVRDWLELGKIVADDHALRQKAGNILKEAKPYIQNFLSGAKANPPKEQLEKTKNFLNALSQKADPKLKPSIDILRNALSE